MVGALLVLLLQTPVAPGPAAAPAQSPAVPPAPPATEIFIARLAPETDSGIRVLAPENISNNPGYDNQPSFVPGGAALLFTSNRDGKQTDIYRYDLRSKSLKALTGTPESEYSPSVTPAGDRFSVIRVEADGTQRLWQFPLSGGAAPALVLNEVKPVGYHAWADADTLVLFVLGDPATLRIAETTTGAAQVVAERPGRCLARTPSGKISFVQKGPAKEAWQIMEVDPATKQITPIAETVEGSEDYAWLGEGRLLMASGPKIFLWDSDYRVKVWREVADVASAGITSITRLAVSPDGKTLAFAAETSK
jgi:dipeptidyl aminopeptidase/acylaminoacyl peptidase